MVLISFEHVDLILPPHRSLFHDLNLHIDAGEIFTVIGPSGVGKTLFLKMIAGIVAPTQGAVAVHGIARRSIGMTFQRSALFDSMSCGENLDFPLREVLRLPAAQRRERVRKALAQVGLSGIENKRIQELSGGMQKRLSIARALILEPRLLLCDDPTAGLDPITSLEITRLLLDVKKTEGKTVVLVTSDFGIAFQISGRIGFLYDGQFIGMGTPTELRAVKHPIVQRYTRNLLRGCA